MIIEVRCYTCGKVIGNMWEYYQREVRRRRVNTQGGTTSSSADRVIYFDAKKVEKTADGEILDELGLTRSCCRTVLLTHVDVE